MVFGEGVTEEGIIQADKRDVLAQIRGPACRPKSPRYKSQKKISVHFHVDGMNSLDQVGLRRCGGPLSEQESMSLGGSGA